MTSDRPHDRTIKPGAGLPSGFDAAVAVALATVACLVVGVTIQVLGRPMNDPDSAASVLFWRHLVSGAPLETFVSTTPKPLLTVLYGIAFDITGDWRSLAVLTLGAFGVAIAAGTLLARRLAGWGAAAFLATALAVSPAIAIEVAHANSLVWAIAGWLVAGAALTMRPARPWIAGLALLVALSTRTETGLLLGPASLWIVGLAVRGARAEARRLAPILVGWLAVPVAALHDLALFGDPTWWMRVPAGYTALTGRYEPPVAVLEATIERLWTMPFAVVLAIVGVSVLARRRAWPALGAVLALAVGVVAFLLAVSWRRIFVTTRYLEQADVGLILAGAVAIGVGVAYILARAPRGSGGVPAQAAALALAVLAGLAVNPGLAPLDTGVSSELARLRAADRGAELALPTLREVLIEAQTLGPVPTPTDGPAGLRIVDTDTAAILVPRALINRLLVDLGTTQETWLGDSFLAFRTRDPLAVVRPGQVVYHDRAGDLGSERFAPFEIDIAVVVGKVRLEPRFVSPDEGVWIVGIGTGP